LKFREESRRFREPLPERIKNKPELFFGLALFYNAWYDLDSERDRPKRITRGMCFSYAVDYDLDEEQSEDLWYHISRMDIEFLEWWKKKQPKARNPKGAKRGVKDPQGSS
jgi:hypothetical protein